MRRLWLFPLYQWGPQGVKRDKSCSLAYSKGHRWDSNPGLLNSKLCCQWRKWKRYGPVKLSKKAVNWNKNGVKKKKKKSKALRWIVQISYPDWNSSGGKEVYSLNPPQPARYITQEHSIPFDLIQYSPNLQIFNLISRGCLSTRRKYLVHMTRAGQLPALVSGIKHQLSQVEDI